MIPYRWLEIIQEVEKMEKLINTKRRIAFIQASWHKDIVDQARISFTNEIQNAGYDSKDIDFFEVPGSFEIPLQAKLLAKSGKYVGIVAAGFVIDGGIYRHDFVGRAVIEGLMQVQLETLVPVLSVVLTPHHFHEHEAHKNFYFDHFKLKGLEAAKACLQTLKNIQNIN
ncbi:6,7-dimethyl-8-ribityllumazine synthase [Leptospira sp. GIMC2001]|uniref:6,7-dimethyl-8-ribityllumazine synthase n=1 Tax=Leptospira sp. GIMC2001 TaxID=1513297 RepID=UPI00234BD676|nr:6,7-dimethyl-8-ribityllumazine synthase [Leptospira sp. GIMC2001]WCL49361.1 6,7-dimethyl-8-ribityllumazine synthase [Leptospira sp. GIMC2001]